MHMTERARAAEKSGALLTLADGIKEGAQARGIFRATLTRNGEIVWRDEFKNLVTTLGKNFLLDNGLDGVAYTAAFYMLLVDGGGSPTYDAADTLASHAGWSENTSYVASTRPAVSWNAASAGAKVSSGVDFIFSADVSIAGVALATNSTKGGTSGTLYSVGGLTGGARSPKSGDKLTVTYTGSL